MMRMNREWAMPNSETFKIPPIADLLDRWILGKMYVVDPFARNAKRAHYTNDLDPTTTAQEHMEAVSFCRKLAFLGVRADGLIFDPPYSSRQIAESYKNVGKAVGMEETQNGRFYREVRDALDVLAEPGCVAISFGWNSAGFGKERGYEIEEILLVAHGGAHNDTIVTVERKIQTRLS